MSFMYQGALLEPQELHCITNTLDKLSHAWTRRAPAPIPIYTLGAATYLDARHNPIGYQALAAQKNLLLMQHFSWLYARLIEHLNKPFGPFELERQLALPGFHIFGNTVGQPVAPMMCQMLERTPASVHMDNPYRNHLIHLSRYQKVDLLHPLSITVCLEMPQSGAGLNTWHALEQVTEFAGHAVIDDRFDPHSLGPATYHGYQLGWVYVSDGHHVHQIAASRPFLPHDRRITLQAHSIQCDGVWRLFF